MNENKYRIASVNNHRIDPTSYENYRISRFIRDPRDLVISGYFYHKRGAEYWCHIVDPTPEDWKIVNGNIPVGMQKGECFTTYLNRLNQEDGIMAEIEFRKFHFESMLQWSKDDPCVKTFKYENIIGNEVMIFGKLFDFYRVGFLEKIFGMTLAYKYSARKQMKSFSHIRNPEPNQWKIYFSDSINEYFTAHHPGLLHGLGYDL